MFSDYQFQYPQAFWLLAAVPLLVIVFALNLAWKKKTRKKMGDPALIRQLKAGYSPLKNTMKFIMVLLAFMLGCIALANPRKPDRNSGDARRGIDIVVALDISNSMKATDVSPDRLTRAKQFMLKLIDNMHDDRLGLVLFAGNAYAQMPLTFDREAAKLYVSAANPGYISAQGTSIGDAFRKSGLLFEADAERFKSIILITDGETHDEDALDMAKEMANMGVMINTLGLGSPSGTTIPDSTGNPKKDASGNVVISKLNEEILKEIAQRTNGRYILLESVDAAIRDIQNQYSGIEKKALGDASLFNYTSYCHWAALPMVLLLMIEVFIPDRKKIAE